MVVSFQTLLISAVQVYIHLSLMVEFFGDVLKRRLIELKVSFVCNITKPIQDKFNICLKNNCFH